MSPRKNHDDDQPQDEAPGQPRLVVVACDRDEVEPDEATKPLQMPPELAIDEEEPTDMFGALALAPPPGESLVLSDEPTDHFGVVPLTPVGKVLEEEEPEEVEVAVSEVPEDTLVGPPRVACAVGD